MTTATAAADVAVACEIRLPAPSRQPATARGKPLVVPAAAAAEVVVAAARRVGRRGVQ